MKKIRHLEIIALIILIALFIVSINYEAFKVSVNSSIILDSKELKDIQSYLNEIANNGFINHTYNDASMIDISEILYYNTYIGDIVSSSSSEYEYLVNTVYNGIPPVGDIITFDPLYIKILYFEKTGLDLSQNINPNIPLNYCKSYISSQKINKEDDYIYCYAYSDTHRLKAKCLSGRLDNGIYYIRYCDENKTNEQYEVVLQKSGNNYIFIQNK